MSAEASPPSPPPRLSLRYAGSRAELGKFSVFLLCLVLAVDMGGQVGLRNPLLPICMIGLAVAYGARLPVGGIPFAALMVGYPTFALLLGLWGGADSAVALSQFQGTVLAFVLYLVLDRAPARTVVTALYGALALTGLLASLWLWALLQGASWAFVLADRLSADSAGFFGARDISSNTVMTVYFKSALFFAPAAIYWLGQRRLLPYAFCVGGLMASLSRSGLFVTGLVSIAFILTTRMSVTARAVLILTGVVFVQLVSQNGLADFMFEVVRAEGTSYDVRAGHLSAVMQLAAEHPVRILFGFGAGSEFYSAGAQGWVTNIEIDHLNTIRKYGLIWSIGFFGFVLMTALRAIRASDPYVRRLGVCLLIGFGVAGTNPVLMSPIFLLMLLATMGAVCDARSASPAGAVAQSPA